MISLIASLRSARDQRIGVLAVEPHRLAELDGGAVVIAFGSINLAAVVMGGRNLAIEVDRLVEVVERALEIAGVAIGEPAIVVGDGARRLGRGAPVDDRGAAVDAACAVVALAVVPADLRKRARRALTRNPRQRERRELQHASSRSLVGLHTSPSSPPEAERERASAVLPSQKRL